MSELKFGEVGERILSWTLASDVPSEFLRYETFLGSFRDVRFLGDFFDGAHLE